MDRSARGLTLTHARRSANGGAMGLSVALAVMVALAPSASRAQAGVTAGVSVGGTNNASSATEGQGTESDGFTRTSLGLSYILRTPRSTHQFAYLFGAYFYVASAQSVSVNNDLNWQGTVNPTAFTDLGLTLGASQGRTNDLDLFRRQVAGVESVARPVGAETFVAAYGGQSFNWQLNPFWSIGENVNSNLFLPVSENTQQARTLGVDGGLTLNRFFIENHASLFVRAGVGRSSRVEVDGAELFPPRQAEWGEAGLGYTHAFNEDWNLYAGGGLLAVRVPQIPDPFLDFSVHGQLSWLTPTGGDLALRADRGVYTNVYVGDVLLQNSVGIQGTHPFGLREAWTVGGAIDYQRSRSLFVIDVNEGKLEIFNVSGTMTYDWTRHRRLAFELNYTYQDSGYSERNGMRMDPFSLHRLMAMATLEFVFPEPEEKPGRRRGRGGKSGGATGDVHGGEGGAPSTIGAPLRGTGKSLGGTTPRGDGMSP